MTDSALLSQLDPYREVAAARVDDPVLSACPFAHRGLMSKKAAGHFGMLARFGMKQVYKARAGGLPNNFVLAVTPTCVHVFDTPVKSFKAGAPKQFGDEV